MKFYFGIMLLSLVWTFHDLHGLSLTRYFSRDFFFWLTGIFKLLALAFQFQTLAFFIIFGTLAFWILSNRFRLWVRRSLWVLKKSWVFIWVGLANNVGRSFHLVLRWLNFCHHCLGRSESVNLWLSDSFSLWRAIQCWRCQNWIEIVETRLILYQNLRLPYIQN